LRVEGQTVMDMDRRIIMHRCWLTWLALACLWVSALVDVRALSAAEGHGHEEDSKPAAAAKLAKPNSDTGPSGVELGEFRIRAYYPVEAKRSTVAFKLYAIVSSENAVEFEQLLENRHHKTRDQVIVATRMVPLADFDDPKLKEFRRRILMRLHRMLPELAIDDVFVSDFRLEVRDI